MKNREENKVLRCKHCGGLMRDYRGSVSCVMCGRIEEHQCERCRFAEEETYELEKKVA